ncbi:hypothetical protein [uncultured Desulfuromusa sp.]|uniref:hypothetical protein n=1 Tax=uncultured Desulfuromusa sp. TaxID=219183 RepID=UPI002AA65572|nr:hypothetical protein [uncultured Desulfuromusa sp.]
MEVKKKNIWRASFLERSRVVRGISRQKEILIASGHELDVRDLLTESWNPEILSLFFGELSLASVGEGNPKNCPCVTTAVES